ncbi:MAG TPA: HDIG domain-containing protein, partial [Candidatus Parcubacteria bacterium]|nr:HDIG domain-containing protein [Candidatus Parcubacteria bacterium]
MEREEALTLLKENIKNKNLIKHSLAVEAAMKSLARYFKEDEEKWGLAGLLHDIDYEKVGGRLEEHSRAGSEMLRNLGFNEEICSAVLTHNEAHGIEPRSL